MSADFHIHIVNTEQERYHCKNYIKAGTWCSVNPFSLSITEDNAEYIANWSRCYDEFLINGIWIHEDDFWSMEFDSIIEDIRRIHVYCDCDNVVDRTENIFICDTIKTDSMNDLPDVFHDNREFKIIDDTMIEDLIKLADEPQKVKEFLEKNKGKESFIIAW